MRVLNTDLFYPQTIMDSDFSPGEAYGSGSVDPDFGFAFDDSNFSDRLLRIEIMPDLPETKSYGDSCSSIADCARNRGEDFKKDNNFFVQSEEEILNCDVPYTVDGVTYENQDEESMAITEEPPSDVGLYSFQTGNDAIFCNDSSRNVDCSKILGVKTRHISSPILAAKSPFFHKESEQRHVTLRIHASEETALLDLLNFMYSNTLSRTTPIALLDVLMAADKFEVASCMRYCSRLLRNLPMTCESALLYLDLPSSVLMADAVQPLTDAAKQFLAARYKDITKKLKKVLTCIDFHPELTSKVVLEALFFKAETPYRKRALAAEEASTTHCRFVERAYKYRPVKVVEFELPRQQCVVYLDLKREECAHLFPGGRVYSQAFHLGGQGFFLSAHCNMDQQSSYHCFGLFLGMQERGSVTFTVDYEFAARSKPTEDYVSKYKGNYTFTGGKAVGYRNLFGIPWTAFMADDSIYFINGILHIRAELTIR